MLEVYKRIKNKRKEISMSQDELAKKIGYYDKSMVSKIERGEVNLSVEKIKEIATVLGTTAGELMGSEGCVSDIEGEAITLLRQLNADGQAEVIKYINTLIASGLYKKHYKKVNNG